MILLSQERDRIISQHSAEINDPVADSWGASRLAEAVERFKPNKQENGNKISSSSYSINGSSLDLSPWQLKPDSTAFNVVLLGCDDIVASLHDNLKVRRPPKPQNFL